MKDWIPALAAVIALIGVYWTNFRSDMRERDKHRREQLASAIVELLGASEEAVRLAVEFGEELATQRRVQGTMTPRWDKPELLPKFREFTAATTRARNAGFKVELLEPRLRDQAASILAGCVETHDAAAGNKHDEVLASRHAQTERMRALMDAYRKLDQPRRFRPPPWAPR
ncbi:hypothetical protein A5666_22795 [Mycolicibacterium fortuitum]|uniref:hypothetical protein n=1 Tax=Mycolicibacterium fortuitum TaxID=1766 RepID=UPI0007EB0106|nr:hypothetical protein [Mycolicibacterium fortuitum]OBA98274.1 hypothetical protein A5665_25715 [Mycolicibacterium fortuitum]OBI70669.1 hypothetical protein A5666_22795 [Mycolicibacterium fortuitum]